MLHISSLNKSHSLVVIAALAAFALSFAITYRWVSANDNATRPTTTALTALSSDRDRDGLTGAVERVQTEVAKLSIKSGNLVEGTRELMESTAYDPKGNRVDNTYYLVSGNLKPGKEEYTYDAKGNISETIIRDGKNSIVSKESYTYEYDAVGNWTKMLTSKVVYEAGKLNQKPAEVTYRRISYYFDQSIADIVKSSPPVKGNPVQTNEALTSLREALGAWVAATNARDIEKVVSFYHTRLDVFYLARNVSQDYVRAEKTRLFKRAELLDIRTGAPEINMSFDARTAIMRFRKPYFIKDDRRIRQGEVIQQLRWLRTTEGWKINGERDEQVLR